MTTYEIVGEVIAKGSSFFLTYKTSISLFGYTVSTKTTDVEVKPRPSNEYSMTNIATGETNHVTDNVVSIVSQLRFLGCIK